MLSSDITRHRGHKFRSGKFNCFIETHYSLPSIERMGDTPFYVYKAKFEDVNEKLVISLYAVTLDGRTFLIRIPDYTFYIYLEADKKRWSKTRVHGFMEGLSVL